jgi:hypothetical protein
MSDAGSADEPTLSELQAELEATKAELEEMRRLTDAMDEHGVETVGDLPEDVLADILGPDWRQRLDEPA